MRLSLINILSNSQRSLPLIITLLLIGCSISEKENFLSLQANIEIKTKELEHKKNNLEDFITKMDGEISLLEKEKIFDIEQFIASELIDLNNKIITLEEKTKYRFFKKRLGGGVSIFR